VARASFVSNSVQASSWQVSSINPIVEAFALAMFDTSSALNQDIKFDPS
jgi:hypothetical protein